MSIINNDGRTSFFPNSKNTKLDRTNAKDQPELNSERVRNFKKLAKRGDAKVQISPAVKDFARAKAIVDKSSPLDNSEKLAQLKNKIQSGSYDINYDAIANKMLTQEY